MKDGLRKIQVDQYPPLSSIRRENGSWRLENSYVYFEQVESMDSDRIPLFD
jgi:hypothetical protein